MLVRQPMLFAAASVGSIMLITPPALSVQDACEPQTQPAERRDAASSSHKDVDPVVFFAELVERYRRMTAYEDTVDVVQVIDDGRSEPCRIESNIACVLDADGRLAVSTPMRDYASMLRTLLPIRSAEPLDQALQDQAIWLAPHMSLRYDRHPLQRASKSPVKPVEARTVIVEDQPVVQLRLSSRADADAPSIDSLVPPCMDHDTCETTFDLYVNPESMLVERIEGDETLPDGRQQKTTMHIQPLRSESCDGDQGRWLEVAEPQPSSSAANPIGFGQPAGSAAEPDAN